MKKMKMPYVEPTFVVVTLDGSTKLLNDSAGKASGSNAEASGNEGDGVQLAKPMELSLFEGEGESDY